MNKVKILAIALTAVVLLMTLPAAKGVVMGAPPDEVPPDVEELCEEQGGEIIAWDECGNGRGYSIPGPAGGDPHCTTGDCCGWYQTAHVHDLGRVIPVADLILKYTPGFTQGCEDYLTVETSPDDETWTWVEEIPTYSQSLDGGWEIYTVKLHNVRNFRYVKLTIPNCYNDYSAVYACSVEEEDKPNLEVKNKREEETTPGRYEIFYVVVNTGSADAPANHSVYVEVDGAIVDKRKIGWVMGPGSSSSYSFKVPCNSPSPDKIKVTADYWDIVDESDENDNCAENEYTYEEDKPDLVIEYKYERRTSPDSNYYTVYFIVSNQGKATAKAPFHVGLYYDGRPQEHYKVTRDLEAGKNFGSRFQRTVWCPAGSSHKIKVCVDTQRQVDEEKEDNNCTENTLARKPDLVVESKYEYETRPGSGYYKVGFQIGNQGKATAQAPFQLILYKDGRVVGNYQMTSDLEAGNSFGSQFRSGVWCSAESPSTIKVCVDTQRQVDEEKEDNNCTENTCPRIEPPGEWEMDTLTMEGRMAYISPASQQVGAGAPSIVGIYVDPAGVGISGGSITVSFDPGVMQVDEVKAGDLLGLSPIIAPGYPKIDNVNGTVDIDLARSGLTVPPTPSGDLAKITFTTKVGAPEGLYNLELVKAQLIDKNFQDIPELMKIGGAIEIVAGYPGLSGDMNQDGRVDFIDLAVLAAHYGETTTPPYPSWDIDRDGVVGFTDLTILGEYYQETD